MSQSKLDILVEKALIYTKLLKTTSELIQILNDHNEDTGDIPLFYEKIQEKARKCIEEIDKLL